MGEAKQEEAKAEAKVEEKKEEKEEKKEEKKEEEKKEEKKEEEAKPSPPPPPPPVILYVDMHCVGCAKKIERCLLKCKGVEEVESDMAKNQLKIKGVVDPQALCSRIQKKTLRSAKVISPLPPPDQEAAADSASKPQVVASQVSGVSTVELHVNMHCEACAQQMRRKILKMRGVQAAETELSSGKVTVTGTMTGDKLVDYIYRRTGKLAKVIPPPPPPPPPKEEEKKDEGKPEDQKPAEEKKEEEKPAAEEKKEDTAEKKEEEEKAAPPPEASASASAAAEEKKEEKKEGELGMQANMQYTGPEDLVKRMMYWNGGYNNYTNYMGGGGGGGGVLDDDYAKRMMPQLPWMPVYVIERPPPPPQMFSDENPNACCIS